MLSDVEHFTPPPGEIPASEHYRTFLLSFGEYLKDKEGIMAGNSVPLEHSFAEGIYIRTMCLPRGFLMIGKIHRDSYVSILMRGTISMLTEGGYQVLEAPKKVISPAWTQRMGFAHTDVIWCTVHPNPDNCTDIATLEERIHTMEYPTLEGTVPKEQIQISFEKFLNAIKNTESVDKGLIE